MKTRVSLEKAKEIAHDFFGIVGEAQLLPGYDDENFKLTATNGDRYILKISRNQQGLESLKFQNALLLHLASKNLDLDLPRVLPNSNGALWSTYASEENERTVRLLNWVDGRIWAHVNPKTGALRVHLGEQAGKITTALRDFEHPMKPSDSHWDLANADWSLPYLKLFSSEEKSILTHFQELFLKLKDSHKSLPKSIVHNDVNDYNILVSHDLTAPTVCGIIDFGDVIHTQTVNDLAIVLAYAVMDVPDPLEAALEVVSGYHSQYKLNEQELKCLYTLTGMRLVTTVTKAAQHKAEGAGSDYHLISEKPAWKALKKWRQVSPEFAEYSFRHACGFNAHPNEKAFLNWTKERNFPLSGLFPSEEKEDIHLLDLKPSSTWLGSSHEFNDMELFEFKIGQIQKEHPAKLLANGYLEPRPVYTAASYDKEGNNGPESRTIHLGIDFWLPSGTPVYTLFDAEVFTAVNDKGYKEYGGLVILKHNENGLTFYSLYGHLSLQSISRFQGGDRINKGDCIGYLGTPDENGGWSPHLHFQLMLSMLNYQFDFPGVTYPGQEPVWKSICPDPNLLFQNPNLKTTYDFPPNEILSFRREHLGKGMSISYREPLHIVRGEGVYLMDSYGRKYLDTVNNVNHVGHQHPRVIAAGQKQMALLNTNTRYLHDEIIKYAEALLQKLPPNYRYYIL